MLLGYNTNGLSHHDLVQAIHLLAGIGYESVAITIDHGSLNPFNPKWREQAMRVKAALDGFQLKSVIETGARFLLDPKTKHEPTLVSQDVSGRDRRVAFYRHAIDVAAMLGSDCVSLWSGIVRDGAEESIVWGRLVSGLAETCDYAVEQGVTIGLEPEPGMFIDTMDRYGHLLDRIYSPALKLTLDVGHLHCLGETPIADQIHKWAPRLVNVHIEDMRAGVHEHLMFGEGEMDFPPIIAALEQIHYRGGVYVELSRHSHEGPSAARKAFDYLNHLQTELATDETQMKHG